MFGIFYLSIIGAISFVGCIKASKFNEEVRQEALLKERQRRENGDVTYGTYIDRCGKTRLLGTHEIVFDTRDTLGKYGRKGDHILLTMSNRLIRNYSAEERKTNYERKVAESKGRYKAVKYADRGEFVFRQEGILKYAIDLGEQWKDIENGRIYHNRFINVPNYGYHYFYMDRNGMLVSLSDKEYERDRVRPLPESELQRFMALFNEKQKQGGYDETAYYYRNRSDRENRIQDKIYWKHYFLVS